MSFELIKAELGIIVENVKINKTIFVERYTPKEWLHLMEECHQNSQKDRKELICVHCNYKKNLKMKLNEHWKKGCKKVIDDNKNQLTLNLYLPLKNITKGIILAKGGNVLEYRAKLEASLKPMHSRAIVTKTVPPMQQKRKKEKSPPLNNFSDNVSDAAKHGLTHKKHLTTLPLANSKAF